jgi:hypothetical protein
MLSFDMTKHSSSTDEDKVDFTLTVLPCLHMANCCFLRSLTITIDEEVPGMGSVSRRKHLQIVTLSHRQVT